MRRITLWLLSTIAAMVLLFSYRTSTMGAGGESAAVAAGTPAGVTGGGSDGQAADAGTGVTHGGAYDGSTAQTRWGPVQVRITVVAGKITDVTAVIYPDGNRHDQQINTYALPILRERALDAQSADIDTVSGATVTSEGYKSSLQSAIDAAHLS